MRKNSQVDTLIASETYLLILKQAFARYEVCFVIFSLLFSSWNMSHLKSLLMLSAAYMPLCHMLLYSNFLLHCPLENFPPLMHVNVQTK